MKYYLIAGEASGDLHASHLMQSLKNIDPEADFRFFGGDNMAKVGGTLVKHYRDLAYMGFIPVLLHLPTILKNMKMCKQDVVSWQPDCVILIDYPGFNLKIAKFIGNEKRKAKSEKFSGGRVPKVFYYISPKIWAWKEHRIKNIKRDVDELFSILPFEVDFFEKKHHYPIHYVGNPTAMEVKQFQAEHEAKMASEHITIPKNHNLKVVAILAGSRKQEIKDNLPAMVETVIRSKKVTVAMVAGAPGIEHDFYLPFLKNTGVTIAFDQTYEILHYATVALVTSGTATLETALFRVPQVVCYKTPVPKFIAFLRKHLLKVKYISLVNLIADREVVPELVADTFSVENIQTEMEKLIEGPEREAMLQGYDEVSRRLGDQNAPDETAKIILKKLNNI
jgi:lipid-A-disaccharide synthase